MYQIVPNCVVLCILFSSYSVKCVITWMILSFVLLYCTNLDRYLWTINEEEVYFIDNLFHIVLCFVLFCIKLVPYCITLCNILFNNLYYILFYTLYHIVLYLVTNCFILCIILYYTLYHIVLYFVPYPIILCIILYYIL